jgi:hypothetical protein
MQHGRRRYASRALGDALDKPAVAACSQAGSLADSTLAAQRRSDGVPQGSQAEGLPAVRSEPSRASTMVASVGTLLAMWGSKWHATSKPNSTNTVHGNGAGDRKCEQHSPPHTPPLIRPTLAAMTPRSLLVSRSDHGRPSQPSASRNSCDGPESGRHPSTEQELAAHSIGTSTAPPRWGVGAKSTLQASLLEFVAARGVYARAASRSQSLPSARQASHLDLFGDQNKAGALRESGLSLEALLAEPRVRLAVAVSMPSVLLSIGEAALMEDIGVTGAARFIDPSDETEVMARSPLPRGGLLIPSRSPSLRRSATIMMSPLSIEAMNARKISMGSLTLVGQQMAERLLSGSSRSSGTFPGRTCAVGP